jgi:hypothetical protein
MVGSVQKLKYTMYIRREGRARAHLCSHVESCALPQYCTYGFQFFSWKKKRAQDGRFESVSTMSVSTIHSHWPGLPRWRSRPVDVKCYSSFHIMSRHDVELVVCATVLNCEYGVSKCATGHNTKYGKRTSGQIKCLDQRGHQSSCCSRISLNKNICRTAPTSLCH